ncbi:MAG: hypothetical protein PHG63_03330 [Candidatus Dojkabacteria bacterium]|nr:hypothetical protein [Candidatus Dojkabacteria bacterium]
MAFFGKILAAAPDLIGPGISPMPGIPRDTSDLVSLIRLVFTTAFMFAGVAAVAFIIVGGYNIIASAGDANKVKKGQDMVTNALIGLVVVVLSGLFFNFIARLLGVEHLITVLAIPTL